MHRNFLISCILIILMSGCVISQVQNSSETDAYVAERTFVEFQKTILIYSKKSSYDKNILSDLLEYESAINRLFEKYHMQPNTLTLIKIQNLLIDVKEYLEYKDLGLWIQ